MKTQNRPRKPLATRGVSLDRVKFVGLLKSARAAAGLSQEELATKMGVSARWVQNLESLDSTMPRWASIVRLADALSVSLDTFREPGWQQREIPVGGP